MVCISHTFLNSDTSRLVAAALTSSQAVSASLSTKLSRSKTQFDAMWPRSAFAGCLRMLVSLSLIGNMNFSLSYRVRHFEVNGAERDCPPVEPPAKSRQQGESTQEVAKGSDRELERSKATKMLG